MKILMDFELNLLYNSSFNTRPNFLSTNQHGAERSLAQNVATNSHSVKYETLRLRYGSLVFLLYNFINKVYSNIDTELCTEITVTICTLISFGHFFNTVEMSIQIAVSTLIARQIASLCNTFEAIKYSWNIHI